MPIVIDWGYNFWIVGYDDYQLFLINSGAEDNENALKLASF